MTRECRGLAEERRLLRNRAAAERPEVERNAVGIAEHDIHALDRHVELVGHDLSESRPKALTEVDLPRERGHGPVAPDLDALLEPLGLALVPHQDGDAALWTARIARPYTPQRQRLPARASRIEVSSGFGSRSRSAAAEMTIPLVQ